MGREAKLVLERHCDTCHGTFAVTAKEIKDHARACQALIIRPLDTKTSA